MTTPMDLPLFGLVKLYETSKAELLGLWETILKKNEITIHENSKIETIESKDDIFNLTTQKGVTYSTSAVLLAIGRRGTPRKLNIPGEMSEKVAYRLLEPEAISGKNIVVVGGGDSAIESALLLSDGNKVVLSYRNDAFNRIKDKNSVALNKAVEEGKIDVRLGTNPILIEDDSITLSVSKDGKDVKIDNDLVYIFAGGELPTQFLQKAGIIVEKKFGETVLKH
jgi:thioredoxin reductase